ncbi:MAG: hypothetical protein NT062_29280, partial [Proteobacteria bacterium]|nr:hypothetical protein [Pseudomonadota bacterium]
ARGATSRILPLLARFGAPGKRLAFDFGVQSKQVRVGQTRMATAYVDLNTHTLPNAAASFVWNTVNYQSTRWADGELERDAGKVGGPKSVEDLPRWLAAAAKRRKITWDPATVRVTSSLRGKARAAAVAWLLGG